MQPRHFSEFADAVAALQAELGELDSLRVLDAGCGMQTHLELAACHVTGIDLSVRQLRRNAALHVAVEGDIQLMVDVDWRRRFDLIVCWNVMEHLDAPHSALENLLSWLVPAGRLVLAVPIYESFKGRVTKHTPLAIHHLFYCLASPRGYMEGAKPFPTRFHPSLRTDRLLSRIERHGATIEAAFTVESYQNKFVKAVLGDAIVDRLNRLCLGSRLAHVSPRATDMILVVRKRR